MQLAPWIRSGPPCSAGTPWFWRVDGIARRIGVFLLFRTCPIPTTLASSKISRITVGTVWNLCPILCKQCCSPSVILRIVVMKCKSPFRQPTHKGRHSVSWRCRKATHSSGVRWIRSPPSTTQSFRSSRNTVTYGLVLDPSNPTFSQNYRRVFLGMSDYAFSLLEKQCSLLYSVNMEKPWSIGEWRFMGPPTQTDRFDQLMSRNIGKW